MQADSLEDVLGLVYQELSGKYSKKHMGQYFTPSPIARMMSQITYSVEPFESEEGAVKLLEPCIGSGVMLLEFA